MSANPVLNNLVSAVQFTQLGVPSSAYVHIPFCRRRCYYCDFPVSVVGDHLRGETSGTIEQYVDWLQKEIAVTPSCGHSLKTVFFGGGTPSLLSVKQLNHILEGLEKQFGIAADAEISMEIDPGTFDWEHVQGYASAGVNRISLGVQAFQQSLLEVCGRTHSAEDVFASVELIRKVGFPEFSLDLISGLPKQTLAQWQESLESAVALAPTHISTYDLTIEAGTAFGRQYQPGAKPLPTDETTAQMYQLSQQVLTPAGYEHYEISNYAQLGHQCRHNRVYWENRPYYGFGMGAASYVQGCRFTRPRKTQEYYQWVHQLRNAGGVLDCPPTLPTEVLLETLMLGLRLAEGLSLARLAEQFGEETLAQIWQCLQPYYQQGWVEVVGEVDPFNIQKFPSTGQLRLTDPEGFLFSNVVLADLFSQLGEV